MKNKKYDPKSLANIKFDVTLNGYSPLLVDKVLDEIIEDYLIFENQIKELRKTNEDLVIENKKLKENINLKG